MARAIEGPSTGASGAECVARPRHERGDDQISPPLQVEKVEFSPSAGLVEQPVGTAGLLGARHVVDAVIEHGDVDPLASLQQLLQGDGFLRAVVPELAVIGYRNTISELCEPAGEHRRDGMLVARAHSHHCRAAKA